MWCRVPFRASSCLTQPFFEPNTLLFQVFEALSSGNTWCHFLMRCPWCSRLTEYLTYVFFRLCCFNRLWTGWTGISSSSCVPCVQPVSSWPASPRRRLLWLQRPNHRSYRHIFWVWWTPRGPLIFQQLWFIIKLHVQHKTANCWTHLRSPCNISFLPWDSTPIPPKTLFETNQLLQTTDLCWGNL